MKCEAQASCGTILKGRTIRGCSKCSCPIYWASPFVIARLVPSEARELAEAISWGDEIAAHLSGARNDEKRRA
jgi:hypothetical protein